MSNASLTDEIRRSIDASRQGDLPLKQLAGFLRRACTALEAMPYEQIRELDTLLLRLDQCVQIEEDGFQSDFETVVSEIEQRLPLVPH